ncbi:odorant receptor 2a-like [Hermetia illucens]|uniref:odorant receptor 2a-like n=1 Tax=Hermetia illucens TaxID=343691 RepID=UPI0018CC37DF|nr:odorant receptor 2a-like [Hermetia illucens]
MAKSQLVPSENFNTCSVLTQVFRLIRILGFSPVEKYKLLFYIYSILLIFVVHILYLLSLYIDLFLLDNIQDILDNLKVTICCTVCTLKVFNTFARREELHRLRNIIRQLDMSVVNQDEKDYLQSIMKTSSRFFFAFFVFYGSCSVTCEIPLIFAKERYLLYSAWFPFDWENSTTAYVGVHLYQFIGSSVITYEDAVNDSYPGTLLWLLKGHLRALGLRISKIGYDPSRTAEDNYDELIRAVKIYGICMKYFNTCKVVMSKVSLVQLLGTEMVLCDIAISILHVDENPSQLLFLFFYFAAMILQISVFCYCGSALGDEGQILRTALYSCNWPAQDAKFRKVLIFFMEHAQNPWFIYAGGVATVSLSTLVSVLQSAYSFFAVLNQL